MKTKPWHSNNPQTYQDVLAAARNASADTLWAVQSTIYGLLFDGQPDFPVISNLIYQLSLDIGFLETLPQSPLTVEAVVAYILQCADFRAYPDSTPPPCLVVVVLYGLVLTVGGGTATTSSFAEFQQSLADGLAVSFPSAESNGGSIMCMEWGLTYMQQHDTYHIGQTTGFLIEVRPSIDTMIIRSLVLSMLWIHPLTPTNQHSSHAQPGRSTPYPWNACTATSPCSSSQPTMMLRK